MTKIEWTDATWNPIVGCSIVSPGCTNCYAMKMAARIEAADEAAYRNRVEMTVEQLADPDAAEQTRAEMHNTRVPSHYFGTTQPSKAGPVWTGKLALAPERILTEPLRRRKPTRYFVNSMSDLFHESVPDEWIDRVFAVMALCPQHTFQVLTKRSAQMRDYLLTLGLWDHGRVETFRTVAVDLTGSPCAAGAIEDAAWPLPNVWLGVSCERQQEADARIPDLLATPAAVRFVSAEPCLSAIDLRDYLNDGRRIGFSEIHRPGVVHDRPDRTHLATLGTAWAKVVRRGSGPAKDASGAGGTQFVRPERVFTGDVRRRSDAQEGFGTPDCLDGFQSSRHPAWDGDQPSGRQQAQQLAGEPRASYAEREHDPRYSISRQDHSPESDTGGQTLPPASCRDQVALGPASDDAGRAGGALRSIEHIDTGHHLSQDVETHSVGLSWVIVGGESGPGARPMHPDWARSIRDQCIAAGVAFFFKQWGEWAPIEASMDANGAVPDVNAIYKTRLVAPDGKHVSDADSGACDFSIASRFVYRLGKKRAGRLLDGRTWDEMPAIVAQRQAEKEPAA